MNDLDLIERLRAAGTQPPAARHTPDTVLAAGRRAAGRRNVLRISGATLSVAVLLVGGMQLTPGSSGTQTVTAAGDGAPGADGPGTRPADKPAPRTADGLSYEADQLNAVVLQEAMGTDFEVNADNPNGTLRPGTDSAADLPKQYSGTVGLMADVTNAAAAKEQCAPMEEKGGIFDGCVTRTLPDGHQVQAHFSRWAPTEQYPQQTAGEAVRVLFLQPNNVLVRVDLIASTDADDSTSASAKDARAWLETMVNRLGAAATDPDVEPEGFDGENCQFVGSTWDCSSGAAPGEKPAATDEQIAKDKKIREAKEAAAAKNATESEAAPADEKALAAKKAAMAKEAAPAKEGPPTGE